MQTYINPPKQYNDHARIMQKVRFGSSFICFKEILPKGKDVKDFWKFCKLSLLRVFVTIKNSSCLKRRSSKKRF